MRRFDDALHILAKKKNVVDHSLDSLARMRVPAIWINAYRPSCPCYDSLLGQQFGPTALY